VANWPILELGDNGISSQSPLKSKPLRLPGQSLDEEIGKWVNDKALGALVGAACFCVAAYFEWFGYLTHAPRRPVLFTVAAAAVVLFAGWRIWSIRARVRRLRLGRDGERIVAQQLECLRESGCQGTSRCSRRGLQSRSCGDFDARDFANTLRVDIAASQEQVNCSAHFNDGVNSSLAIEAGMDKVIDC